MYPVRDMGSQRWNGRAKRCISFFRLVGVDAVGIWKRSWEIAEDERGCVSEGMHCLFMGGYMLICMMELGKSQNMNGVV